jgi:hypothetical protein
MKIDIKLFKDTESELNRILRQINKNLRPISPQRMAYIRACEREEAEFLGRRLRKVYNR